MKNNKTKYQYETIIGNPPYINAGEKKNNKTKYQYETIIGNPPYTKNPAEMCAKVTTAINYNVFRYSMVYYENSSNTETAKEKNAKFSKKLRDFL